MTAKKKPGALAAAPEGLELETGGLSSPGDELLSLIEELEDAGGGVVKVEQMRPGQRPVFCGEMDARGFTLPLLQERFGGGEFALTVLDSSRKYRKRATVAVAQPIKPAEPAAGGGALDRIASLLENQQKVLAVLAAGIAGGQPTQTRAQVLEELKTMREILGGSASAVGPEKILEVLRQGIELAKETAAGGESDGVYGVINRIIETVGPHFANLVQAAAQAPRLPGSPAPAPRLPAQPQAGQEAAPMPNDPAAQQSLRLRTSIAFLLQSAALGAEPAEFVGMVLDSVPEPIIRGFLSDGDPVEKLALIDARVRTQAQWFRSLGALLQEELADAPSSGGPASPDLPAVDDS